MHQKDLFNEKNIFLTFKAAGDWKKLFKVIQVYKKICLEISKVPQEKLSSKIVMHFLCSQLQFLSNISKYTQYRPKNSKRGRVKPRSDIP